MLFRSANATKQILEYLKGESKEQTDGVGRLVNQFSGQLTETMGADFEKLGIALKNATDAQTNAVEAAGLHLYGMESDEEIFPIPSQALAPELIKGCIVTPVSIYPDIVRNEMDNRRVKTNTTIPNWLKKIAEENHVNYSHLLETALMDYLGLSGKKQFR